MEIGVKIEGQVLIKNRIWIILMKNKMNSNITESTLKDVGWENKGAMTNLNILTTWSQSNMTLIPMIDQIHKKRSLWIVKITDFS